MKGVISIEIGWIGNEQGEETAAARGARGRGYIVSGDRPLIIDDGGKGGGRGRSTSPFNLIGPISFFLLRPVATGCGCGCGCRCGCLTVGRFEVMTAVQVNVVVKSPAGRSIAKQQRSQQQNE